MKKGVVISMYVLGAVVFLAGLGVMLLRLTGVSIEAPVEAFVVGGFSLLIAAKLLASKFVGEVSNG